MSDFHNYFSKLSNDILQNKNDKAEEFSTQHNFNDLNCSYEELDRKITVNDLEDEFHFILICPCYSDTRKKFIRKYFYKNPSMFKFIELLKSDNRTNIVNLTNFIKNAVSIRTSLTHN